MKLDRNKLDKLFYSISVFLNELNLIGLMLRLDFGSYGRLFLQNSFLFSVISAVILGSFLLGGRESALLILLIISPFIAFFAGTKYKFDSNFIFLILSILISFFLIQLLVGSPIIEIFRVTDSPQPAYTGFSSEPSFFNEVITSVLMLMIIITQRPKAILISVAILLFLYLVTSRVAFIQSILIIIGGFAYVRICYFLNLNPKKIIIIFFILLLFLIKIFYLFFEEVGIFFLEYFASWRQLGNIIGIGQSSFISLNLDYTSVVDGYIGDEFQYKWGSAGIYGYIISAFSQLSFFTTIFGILPTCLILYVIGKRISIDGNFYTDSIFIASFAASMIITPKWLMLNFIIIGYIYKLETQKDLKSEV